MNRKGAAALNPKRLQGSSNKHQCSAESCAITALPPRVTAAQSAASTWCLPQSGLTDQNTPHKLHSAMGAHT